MTAVFEFWEAAGARPAPRFLSALVPYWCLFGLLMRGVVLRLRSLPAALAVVLLLALPPWLAYVLPSALPGGDATPD